MAANNLTRLWLGEYYLTYPNITLGDEVRNSLSDKSNFLKGRTLMLRDNMSHFGRGFTLLDRHYLSARWLRDAYSFALTLVQLLM
jgi:protease I